MGKCFWRNFIFAAVFAGAALFASCELGFNGDSFQNKAGAYFKEMTSTASIEAYKIIPDNAPTDKSGNLCLSYEDTYTVEFTLRNPQHYSFSLGRNMAYQFAQSGLPGSDLVTLSQGDGDTTKLRMTFPAEFLAQNAAGANISPYITLMHPVSMVSFGVYNKLKLSSDATPPKVSGALTMQTTETPSRWVLCFNLPTRAMVQTYHNDIESVSVNGKTFAATVAADGSISYEAGAELTTTAPSNIVANQNTGLSFDADENAAYFPTGDEADEKEKIYTVVVTDKAGLSSSLAISTRGFKLGAPDAFAKTDTQFANKFKIYAPADPDGTKNSVDQDEDDSVYVTIKAEPKTASFDYTDPVSGETKHVDSYDYDMSDACVMWEVYRDEACSSFVSAGKINGLQGTISIPAGTSFVRAYVRKPLYSDSEVIKWKCRAVFTRFYISEEGDDNAEGSRKKPFRTIQRAVDTFVDGVASGDYIADSLCDIRLMTDLTTPDDYNFGAHNGYLIDASDPSLSAATIKVAGLGGTKTVSAEQAGTAVRKLVNAAVGKTVIQGLNLTGGAVAASDDYTTSALIHAVDGAELNINSSKIYGNVFSGEKKSSPDEASLIFNEGTLKMSATTVCDNTSAVTGSGSYNPYFYAFWSGGGSSAGSELTDCEFTGHGECWTVIYIDSLPLKMTGGAIKNNVGCNYAVQAGEMAELIGVEITGNTCKTAALDSYNGLFTLDGCTITGNVSTAAPALGKSAGISIERITPEFIIKGKNTIYDNHFKNTPTIQSNLCVPLGYVLTVGGNISGSKIGVSMPFTGATKPTKDAPIVFTKDYATPSYANPDTPGSVFISENDYGVAAMASGTNVGEAVFAVSSGGIYSPYDYTIELAASGLVANPGVAKSVALTTTVTRKEPAGSTPATTHLYYNPADKKLYLEDTFETLAVADRASDPDYNKVAWTAALYSGTRKACDVPVSSSASGLTAEVPAVALEDDYSLRVSAAFLGLSHNASFAYKVKNSLVSVDGASVSGAAAVPNSGVFISGRNIKIKSLIACDHQVTQKEWFEATGKTLRDQAGPTASIGYREGDDIAINYVNWFDALVYCNKKSAADNLTPCYTISGSTNPDAWGEIPTSSSKPTYAAYSAVTCDWNANGWRLPTEAEWEYLARGGNLSSAGQTKYSGSDNINDVCWCSNNITITPRSPQDVRTKAPNSLQLYDMSGNVFEWCWDRWIETVVTDTPMTGPESGDNRACRGGSYGNTQTQDQLTVYGRSNQGPSYRSVSNGLRVVRSEDTATSYVLPTYCGSKEPGEALAVGDIVFDDGSATPYAAGLTLSDAQKARAIAVIYYTGSGSAGSYDLGEKTLGVGIKEWKYNQSLRLNGSSDSTTPKWSINAPLDSTAGETGIGADKRIVPNDTLEEQEHKKNGLLTLALMKENVAEYNVAAGIIPDSPVFYWAEHYGEGSDKIAGNTALSSPYNSGWYLPGQDELRAICANKATINSALGAIGSSAVQIAVGSTASDNANIYHSATGTNVINAANLFYGATKISYWRGETWSVRAVRLFP
ncbi:MAG: formylglycine-generating enzyme family protein [Treponema sp.]|nr:formylglycine-generating enzyme family protein [Treponema sp.]